MNPKLCFNRFLSLICKNLNLGALNLLLDNIFFLSLQ